MSVSDSVRAPYLCWLELRRREFDDFLPCVPRTVRPSYSNNSGTGVACRVVDYCMSLVLSLGLSYDVMCGLPQETWLSDGRLKYASQVLQKKLAVAGSMLRPHALQYLLTRCGSTEARCCGFLPYSPSIPRACYSLLRSCQCFEFFECAQYDSRYVVYAFPP